MKTKIIIKKILLFLFTLSLFCSCATKRPVGKTEAEVLFKEANQFIENGRFLLATERLNTLRSQFPYSFYATHAELLQADILFKQENYVEAAASYILFKDFHPKHEKISYVIWRIAESFFLQLPSTYDRDLTSGLEAIKYYQELVSRFPNSKERKQSEEKIKEIENLLHLKELYIADFYFKTKVFDSARFRYLSIIENNLYNKPIDHSASRIVSSSYFLNDYESCLKYSDLYVSKVATEYKNIISDFRKKCSDKIK